MNPRVPVDWCGSDRKSVRAERFDGRVAYVGRVVGWRRFDAAGLRWPSWRRRQASSQTADAKLFDDQFRPLLVRHCVTCHGGDKPKGKLRLDNLTTDFADAATLARWTAVIERLEAGEMPPKGKPRPPAQDVQALTGWLAPRVAAADAAARAAQGRVILRRLNRVEYENTVRDLLGINVNLKEQLPEDGSADGFDNAGAANHTSSFLMEKYLEAADKALNMAIANRPKPPPAIDQAAEHQGRIPGSRIRRERVSLSQGRRGCLLLLVGMAQRRGDRVLPDRRVATIGFASRHPPFKARASRSPFA